MELNRAHVLITGGSRGLGLAMAQAFAQEGANLTLVARGRDALEKAAADVGGRALTADMNDPGQVDGLLAQAEQQAGAPIDAVVLNAGIDVSGRFADQSAAGLRQLWQVNVVAPAELMRQARELMAPRGRGHIVAMSSLAAQVAMPGMASYAASKAALSQLVIGIRPELRRDGITTTLVEIGQASTDLYATLREYPPAAKAFDRATRLGFARELPPDEVAEAVVDAVRKGKEWVVRPRRSRFQALLAHTPQFVAHKILPYE